MAAMIAGLPEEEYFVSGHRACAGCGAAIALRLITKAIGKNSIICNATGCAEVFTTPHPETSWKLPWIHSLFENAAPVANGVWAALKSEGLDQKINVIALGGDGATFDIGFGYLSGMFERGPKICYICYDNEAYMNTGIQRSGATPFGAGTTTCPPGKISKGKVQVKKDLLHILAAHDSTYLATASIAWPLDLVKKIQKALTFNAPTFIHLNAPCPTGWYHESSKTVEIARLATQTGVFPLFEIENGKHNLNMPLKPRKPVEEYIRMQKRFSHLGPEDIKMIQESIDKKCEWLEKLVKCGL